MRKIRQLRIRFAVEARFIDLKPEPLAKITRVA
jgi:hypothetical protein